MIIISNCNRLGRNLSHQRQSQPVFVLQKTFGLYSNLLTSRMVYLKKLLGHFFFIQQNRLNALRCLANENYIKLVSASILEVDKFQIPESWQTYETSLFSGSFIKYWLMSISTRKYMLRHSEKHWFGGQILWSIVFLWSHLSVY